MRRNIEKLSDRAAKMTSAKMTSGQLASKIQDIGSETEQEHRRRIVTRLARIEGQVRGIQSMITSNCTCEDVAQQITAVRRAMDKVFYEMLACSLVTHVDSSRDMDDIRASTRELARLLTKFG